MKLYVFSFVLSFIFSFQIFAQKNEPSVAHAIKIKEKIQLDGILNEPAWIKAPKISNFRQRELHEGALPTEKTKVAFLYDDKNLYIGVWCYDKEPEKIIATKMKRDFRWWTDDNFEIIISPFNDNRNGYLFVTNPNGAMTDLLVTNEGEGMNDSWNGIWDVATTVNDSGWFAEIEIPFSTFKFKNKKEQVWAINMERNIRRKREQLLWQGYLRNYELEMISKGGKLVGIRGIQSTNLIELKPFISGGFDKPSGERWQKTGKIGLDVNYLFTPTMKLNLTFNTDFSQVESDLHRINLSRFSIFYPEKREFFLEGKNLFEMNITHGSRIFYSRRIGLENGEEVPIYAGARLLGKAGSTNIGLLTMQTAPAQDTIPTTNFTVLRLRQDVLERSSIGAIVTAKNNKNGYNYVYGVEGNYVTSKFLGNQNLVIDGAFSQSFTKGATNKNNLSYRFEIDYPNDLMDWNISIFSTDQNYNPEIGYVRRRNFTGYHIHYRYTPRPNISWIQKLNFKPLDIDWYNTKGTGELESMDMEFRPLGVVFSSGDRFEFNIKRQFDRVDEPFRILNTEIPAGKYWGTMYELQGGTFSGRRFSVYTSLNYGDFYTGKGKGAYLGGRLSINKHMALSTGYKYYYLSLENGSLVANEINGSIEYSFNPKLYSNLFAQWNNEENLITLNYRINWIPAPGSYFYFVINQLVSTLEGKFHTTDFTVLAKLIWRFTI